MDERQDIPAFIDTCESTFDPLVAIYLLSSDGELALEEFEQLQGRSCDGNSLDVELEFTFEGKQYFIAMVRREGRAGIWSSDGRLTRKRK